jgi:hypothetical protein
MPAISMFYGVVIYIYFFDNKKHNKPHIHVKYAGSEVVLGCPMVKSWKVVFPTIK